jgi:hypothetical protein
MIIHKIHFMQWADEEKTHVNLVADIDVGAMQQITTPYGKESIIWQWVQEYPVLDIQDFVAPEVVNAENVKE